MSRRIPARNNEPQSQNILIAEYAVALNDKSRLETENALLKLNIEGHQEKYTKLHVDYNHCKSQLQQYEQIVSDLQKHLKQLESKCRCEEKENKRYEVQETKLKVDVEVLKEELQESHEKVNDLALELNKYRNKSREYKEKLRYSMKILDSIQAVNIGKTVLCDKECQTKNKRSKSTPVNYLEGVEYDERILSEIFYKSNPFMDSFLS